MTVLLRPEKVSEGDTEKVYLLWKEYAYVKVASDCCHTGYSGEKKELVATYSNVDLAIISSMELQKKEKPHSPVKYYVEAQYIAK